MNCTESAGVTNTVKVDMSASINGHAPQKPVDMNTWIRDSIKK